MTDAADAGRSDAGLGVRLSHRSLWLPLAVALASRLLLLGVGFLATSLRGTLSVSHAQHAPARLLYRGALAHLLNGWTNWDGQWYLRIASAGYAVPHSQAFFPLYPLLVGLSARGTGASYELAGIALSWACFVGAAVLLYSLTAALLDERVALLSVVFLAIAPTSLFFGAVYTESLFLLFALACFWFAQRRRWALAGLMGLLAALTRSAGVLLVLPLILLYGQAVEWQWHRIRAGLLAVLLVPCGTLVYMAYLWRRFGDPLLFQKAEAHWRQAALPYVTVWRGLKAGCWAGVWLLTGRRPWSAPPHPLSPAGYHSYLLQVQQRAVASLVAVLALALVVTLIVAGWRRLPAAYTVFAVAVVTLPLFTTTRLEPLNAYPRYVAVAFPLYMALACLTVHRPWLRYVAIAACLAGLVWLTVGFVHFEWVA